MNRRMLLTRIRVSTVNNGKPFLYSAAHSHSHPVRSKWRKPVPLFLECCETRDDSGTKRRYLQAAYYLARILATEVSGDASI